MAEGHDARGVPNADLTAENVQDVLQGLLDAWRELSLEMNGKRAARWDIINEGLLAAEGMNNRLKDRLRACGIAVAESRSK